MCASPRAMVRADIILVKQIFSYYSLLVYLFAFVFSSDDDEFFESEFFSKGLVDDIDCRADIACPCRP